MIASNLGQILGGFMLRAQGEELPPVQPREKLGIPHGKKRQVILQLVTQSPKSMGELYEVIGGSRVSLNVEVSRMKAEGLITATGARGSSRYSPA